MADYQMAERGDATVVSIIGYDGPRLPLLQAFEAHADGRAFDLLEPVVELAEFEADESDGRIELTLRPSAGARLDRELLARTLEDTLTRFEGVSL